MRICRTSLALMAALITSTGTATAQQSLMSPDSAGAQIRTSLRAFYFSLAHGDWEALTADVLAAKVVASRTVPGAVVTATSSSRAADATSSAGDPAACSTKAPALVNQATIRFDGDWAEVSVPRCTAALAGADEFRLIHFEERWRFVRIDLYEAPVNVSADR